MKFKDIEQFTSWGAATCDVEWNDLEWKLDSYTTEYDLDLDPDFQRGHVWSPDKQIAYVEYILRGGQFSRHIIFNCAGWMKDFTGRMTLVDGKQRLQAVRLFMRNELPIFGGYYLKDYQLGKSKSKVPRSCSFMFYINDLETRKEVLKFYLDLNSGGVVHTPEELGRVRKLLEEEIE
jgi:hypothetical protein